MLKDITIGSPMLQQTEILLPCKHILVSVFIYN